MATILDKIAEIEDEMARTQRNKATANHLGMLKAKLAKLRRDLIAPPKSGGKGGDGFDVKRGSASSRVGLVGFPSVGKSTLLSSLTPTTSEAGDYEFTTLTCVPGIIQYNGARIQVLLFYDPSLLFGVDSIRSCSCFFPLTTLRFSSPAVVMFIPPCIKKKKKKKKCTILLFRKSSQLLDLPGIIEGANDGKGRGRQVIGTARTCDLICIVIDAMNSIGHKRLIEHELEGFGIRLNKKPPNLTFRRKERGGLNFTATVPLTHLNHEVVKSILYEYKVHNADVCLREDCTADDLIDVIEGNRRYIPCLYILNKCDQITMEELEILCRVPNTVPISAYKEWGYPYLLETMWTYLDLDRIYTKPKNCIPDYDSPVVLKKGSSVSDFCRSVHKDLLKDFKFAIVWGSSVKHNGQRCGLDHILEDGDIVQIVKKT
mmetsp:Transcript_18860/g.56547  ORF Transcript_18860/g.56547 Transcript_18860/m.56547 type:complete len:430 (-) Transcript_18860:85-1374(-)